MVGDNCSCDFHPSVTDVLGLEICNFPIVGAWVLAILIAVIGGNRLSQLGPSVVGSMSYSVTFYTYGVMISSGLIVHSLYLVECGTQDPTNLWMTFLRLDGSLTSCIGISFLFNGLIDLRVISERGLYTCLAMVISYSWIFYVYFIGATSSMHVYFSCIFIGCGTYVIAQAIIILYERLWKESLWLLVGGLIGGGCLVLIRFYPCWMCEQIGAWSVEGIWYYGSDISMFFVFMYVWHTRKVSRCANQCPRKTQPGIKNNLPTQFPKKEHLKKNTTVIQATSV